MLIQWMCLALWCTDKVCIAQFSIMVSILNSGGIVGSSYVMVSALKCVMTCESEKRSFVRVEVVIPILVWCYKDCDCV